MRSPRFRVRKVMVAVVVAALVLVAIPWAWRAWKDRSHLHDTYLRVGPFLFGF